MIRFNSPLQDGGTAQGKECPDARTRRRTSASPSFVAEREVVGSIASAAALTKTFVSLSFKPAYFNESFGNDAGGVLVDSGIKPS